MNNFTEDYYKILQISSNASQDEIRAAYLRQSKENHPDFGGTTDKMQLINEAYRILKDITSREEYDKWYHSKTQKKTVDSDESYTEYQWQEPRFTAYTCDYERGIITERILFSEIPFSLFDIVDEDGYAYAYTKLNNGRKTRVFISRSKYEKYKALYQKKIFSGRILNKNGVGYISGVSAERIINNYRPFFYLTDVDLYVIKTGNFFWAVDKESWESAQKERHRKVKARRLRNALFTVAALALVSVFYPDFWVDFRDTIEPIFYINDVEYNSGNDVQTNVEPTPQLIEEALPAHNWCFLNDAGKRPNFEIETTYSDNNKYYYLKLVNISTKRQTQAVFIYAGQKAKVYVPQGTYYVRWTSGSNWYGFEHYFNTGSAQQAEDTFTFDEQTAWSVTLYPVIDGNLETENIDMDEF